LAITISGPCGTAAGSRCQARGTPNDARVSCCRRCRTGLVSTRCTCSAAANAGTTRAARSASVISVPRPGPSSTSATCGGAPIARHTAAAHSPISSPNIWLISAAVMKSPARPNGSRVE